MTESDLWFRILFWFAESFSWGPKEVADLTVEQMVLYVTKGSDPTTPEPEWFSPETMKAILKAEIETNPPPEKG